MTPQPPQQEDWLEEILLLLVAEAKVHRGIANVGIDEAKAAIQAKITEREKQLTIRELSWCLRNPQKSIQARLVNLTAHKAKEV